MGSLRPAELRDFRYAKRPAWGRSSLLPETQLPDQVEITLLVLAAEIIQQRAALVDQHQKAAPAVVVLGVALEMLGQVGDAFGEDRDLDLGRTGVALALAMLLDERLLALRCNRHRFT